jgi:hypothetical protein
MRCASVWADLTNIRPRYRHQLLLLLPEAVETVGNLDFVDSNLTPHNRALGPKLHP